MIFDAPLFDNAAARVVRARLPGERGLPLVGETLRILKDPVSTAVRLHQKHGPVYWSNAFGMTSIVVSGPEALRAVFTDPTSAYSNGQAWEFYIGKFFERGLMLLDFAEHKFHRGVMQTAFKRQAIERYFQSMQPTIARAVSGWPSGEVRVAKRLKQLTLDVAIETFMGERPGPEADAVNVAFVDTVRAGTAFIRHPVPFGRWGKGLRGRQVLERFIRTRIPKKRASPSHDLFSRLCEATDAEGNRFTDDDIVNHMIFLMMAAHDTSTITLTSLLYQLARHPAWQERLRNELSALPAGDLTPVSFDAAPSLDLAIKEAMRLLTPLPATARMTIKEVDLLGHLIPAGVPVAVSMAATHRLPAWWTAPEEWDPDRFGPERAEHRKHPFLFSPFGGGAHKCIGMHFGELEIRSVVHHVLSRFRLSVPRSYELPVDYTSLPVAADGLPMRLDRISA
jgi:cytochrome P450